MATTTLAAQTRGLQAYQAVNVQSRSPLELVLMLADGALRFLHQAREAGARGDITSRAAGISRTLAIIGELQSTLNMEEGGTVASELERLYSYMSGRLLDVTLKRDMAAIDEVHKLMALLRDGWAQASEAARGIE
jgi:flagellar protein FliS